MPTIPPRTTSMGRGAVGGSLGGEEESALNREENDVDGNALVMGI